MNILITGGAGFIGAHLAKVLISRGDDVVLIDNFTDTVYAGAFKRERLAALVPDFQGRLVEGSILDQAALEQAFARGPFDAVVHLAALANPGLSMDAAHEYTQVNIVGTLNVLEGAVKHKAGQLIFAGSSSVYNDEQTPFEESQYPLRPRSPYGASKASAELYCASWSETYQLPITVTRFFTVYGPWGRPDMAPFIFADKILKGEGLEISEGRQRDFTYIDDIITGLLAALGATVPFEIINLGRGQPVALDRFVAAIETAAGSTVPHSSRVAPPGEMRITYADTTKAKRLLGYEPKVSVEEGAKHLVEWMKAWKHGR